LPEWQVGEELNPALDVCEIIIFTISAKQSFMEIFSNIYFWVALVSNCCWQYLLTHPYLVSQMNENVFGTDWRDAGEKVELYEDKYFSITTKLPNWFFYLPKYSFFFYLFPMWFKIGFLWFFLTVPLGLIFAYLWWRFIFRTNVIVSKIFFTIIWWCTFVFAQLLLVVFAI